jgi:hypothetical protein
MCEIDPNLDRCRVEDIASSDTLGGTATGFASEGQRASQRPFPQFRGKPEYPWQTYSTVLA